LCERAKFDSPLPEDLRANILSTADSPRHHCKLGGAPPRFPAPVSTEDRSGVGGSSDGQDEQSRIILPPETGEQPSLAPAPPPPPQSHKIPLRNSRKNFLQNPRFGEHIFTTGRLSSFFFHWTNHGSCKYTGAAGASVLCAV